MQEGRPKTEGEKRERGIWGKKKLEVRTEQRDRNEVRSSREGGRTSGERESVFARGSVGDDKTEAS